MVRVSILTPTYNHESFVRQTIESVLSQRASDWELIVVDDGSTDRTACVAESFQDPRLRVIRQEHRGRFALADTYARALAEARGEICALLEGDDFWAPRMLERLLPAFDDPGVVLSYGITQHVTRTGAPFPATTPSLSLLARSPRDVLFNDPVGSAVRVMCRPDEGVIAYPCATLIRRAALGRAFDSVSDRHAVDYATFLSLALRGRFHFVPEIVAYWRRHAGSANTSAQLESMLRADARYALDFLARERLRLPPPVPDPECVARRWERLWSGVRLGHGRVLLLQGSWPEARREFLRVFGTTAPTFRLALAALGVACSFLRRDLEGVCRLRGPERDLARLYAGDAIAR